MRGATRRRLAFVGAIAVPVLAAAAVLLLLPPRAGAAFETCRTALRGRVADSARAGTMLREFGVVAAYRHARFNVNGPYAAGMLNVLLPDTGAAAETAWPVDACGLPPAPATCAARSRDSTIVCNPALASQVLSRRAQPGPWIPGAYMAARYLVFSVLGHELAHLSQPGTRGPRHALAPGARRVIRCARADPPDSTDEQQADLQGMAAACQIVRGDPMGRLLPQEPGEVLRVLQQARNDLDEEYYATEDACVGDEHYPSISRRKHRFTRGFLQCLYPGLDNPVLALANLEADAFAATEARLRERQRVGHVASGGYGRARLYDHTVVPAGTGRDAPALLTFDASGTASSLWRAHYDGKDSVRVDSLAGWPRGGRALYAQPIQDGARFLIRGGNVLRLVTVACGDRGTRERCAVREQSRPLLEETDTHAGSDGTVLLRVGRQTMLYRTPEDAVGDRPALTVPDTTGTPEFTTVGGGLAVRLRAGDQGLYMGDVIRPGGGVSWFFLNLGGEEKGCLEAPRLIGDRLLFLLRRGGAMGNNCLAGFMPGVDTLGRQFSLHLWDCPTTLVTSRVPAPCDVYAAPYEASTYIPSGSLDLTALTEVRIDPVPGLDGAVAVFNRGAAWILDRRARRQDVVPARGLVRVDTARSEAVTYRARVVDHLAIRWTPATRERRAAGQL